LAEREEATRKIKNGKAVTPTLRVKTHEQTTRYLNTHCASLHGLVVGTVSNGTQMAWSTWTSAGRLSTATSLRSSPAATSWA
jgi:hypothetical protein